ncbi:MAG: hypothetical protein ACTSRU_19985 [Candidatus Hodarchaeales archaeon]
MCESDRKIEASDLFCDRCGWQSRGKHVKQCPFCDAKIVDHRLSKKDVLNLKYVRTPHCQGCGKKLINKDFCCSIQCKDYVLMIRKEYFERKKSEEKENRRIDLVANQTCMFVILFIVFVVFWIIVVKI